MLEESVSLWTSMYSWFTPTVLFVFLNLMIGTIAITSSLSSSSAKPTADHQIQRSPSVLHRLKSISFSSDKSPTSHLGFLPTTPDELSLKQPPSIEQNQPFISRSPSVLERIKSFNLYNYISHESASASDSPAQETKPSLDAADETLHAKSGEEEEGETSPSLEEVYSTLTMTRTMSDTEPAAGVIPPKLPQKLRKSASTKSPFAHFEEDDIAVVETRRPATVREGRVSATDDEGEPADEEVDAKADDFINRFKQQLKLQRIDSIMRYKEMVKKGSEK